MKRHNIRIAIQKKGYLKEPSLTFLASMGFYPVEEKAGTFIVPCKNANVEILYVRHGDIPQYVQSGAADFAIVGSNLLHEDPIDIAQIRKLDFGHCRLIIAVPVESAIQHVSMLEGERIATSYPNSLRQFLQAQKIHASIVDIKGSVEVTPALGLADAVCDLTQTGSTLEKNALRIIETLFHATAVLIESPFQSEQKEHFIDSLLMPTQ